MGINNTSVQTHGDYFWHSIRLKKKSPLFHRWPTYEAEHPYRQSNSLIFRLPWSEKGLVVGKWGKETGNEDTALLGGMGGRVMDDPEFQAAEKAQIRRNMIKKQFSADDQRLMVEALDL